VGLNGVPEAGGLWSFLVSALTAEGEGSLGLTSACEPRQADRCTCTLPPDEGPCDGSCLRWFHNAATGECEVFVWGCCGGNANNFPTEAECSAVCHDPCALPPVAGICLAAIPRWYHNVLTRRCEIFIWGGCGGNGNNFPTEEECQAQCVDPCLLPPDTGPCDGVCPRWYFDPETGACQEFVWGCCGGNANNFPTEESCAATCATSD
jgi:hypothetical protein